MKIFLPQFLYSRPTYQRARPQRIQSSLSKNSEITNRQRHSSFYHTSHVNQNFNRPKSVLELENKKSSTRENQDNRMAKSKIIDVQRNKSEILQKLNSQYEDSNLYCTNFTELALEANPEIQKIKGINNIREKMIHSRKHLRAITQDREDLSRDNQKKKIRNFNKFSKPQNFENQLFLITKKIAQPSPEKSKKERKNNSKDLNGNKERYREYYEKLGKTTKMPLRRMNLDYGPWSPTKQEHEIDQIFPAE